MEIVINKNCVKENVIRFANDTVLLATTKSGLQGRIDCVILTTLCRVWQTLVIVSLYYLDYP